jgi:O-acetyl-ADP-ribose deacetylase (regulator of RNase III)
MLYVVDEDIFKRPADVYVNPVNCEGICGAGLALAFKRLFPDNYQNYRTACKLGELSPGEIFIRSDYNSITGRTYHIFNLATKGSWKDKSKLEYIRKGMKNLVEAAKEVRAKKVRIPALGCGCGGLIWPDVLKVIEEETIGTDDIDFYLMSPMRKDN